MVRELEGHPAAEAPAADDEPGEASRKRPREALRDGGEGGSRSIVGVARSEEDVRRKRNRDHARRSRQKKKEFVEGLVEQVRQLREKQRDDERAMEKARKELAALEELVSMNRKLAQENLRLQSILFPDPSNPLDIVHPLAQKRREEKRLRLHQRRGNAFLDAVERRGGPGAVAELFERGATLRCAATPDAKTPAEFMEKLHEIVGLFADFRYVRLSTTATGDRCTIVATAVGRHTHGGPVPPSRPPREMEAPAVFAFTFGSGGLIAHVEHIFDSASAFKQLGWPLDMVRRERSPAKSREGGRPGVDSGAEPGAARATDGAGGQQERSRRAGASAAGSDGRDAAAWGLL